MADQATAGTASSTAGKQTTPDQAGKKKKTIYIVAGSVIGIIMLIFMYGKYKNATGSSTTTTAATNPNGSSGTANPLTVVQGATGPAGSTGPAGPAGKTGATGKQGPPGKPPVKKPPPHKKGSAVPAAHMPTHTAGMPAFPNHATFHPVNQRAAASGKAV
jgi:hypothetical protein